MTSRRKALVKIRRFFRVLGPGLVTGASDDDPSGIATYPQAGTLFGIHTLCTAVLVLPLMVRYTGNVRKDWYCYKAGFNLYGPQ
jgi:Mn2+/Fe2+ NRAMP family transporter